MISTIKTISADCFLGQALVAQNLSLIPRHENRESFGA